MKKVLIVGNHSCSNRGDAAIARGLLSLLKEESYEVDFYSRNPVGASKILNLKAKEDLTKVKSGNNSLLDKLINKCIWLFNIDPVVVLLYISYYSPFFKRFLPCGCRALISDMSNYDIIILVGGSNLVDLYGMSQYRAVMCAIAAKKPIYLSSQSLGPFKGIGFRLVSNWCFKRVSSVIVRDNESSNQLDNLFPKIDYLKGADTAWLVPSEKNITTKEDVVAITVRNLAPFDKRLGVTQDFYEQKMARLCEELIDRGMKIKFFATCTSFDGYHNDDRITANSVRNKVAPDKREQVTVVEDELDDFQLGMQLAKCKLTVGTRLHSCIISMNFGTPAIAIGYEHKSKGMYNVMGLDRYVIDLSDINKVELLEPVAALLDNFEPETKAYDNAIIEQRRLARDSNLSALEKILQRNK